MKTRIIIIDILTLICLPIWAEDDMRDIMLSGGNISTTLFNSQEKFWNYSNVMKTLNNRKEGLDKNLAYQFTEWISADLEFFKNEKSAVVGFEFKVNDNLKFRPNLKMTIPENTNILNNLHAYLNCIYSF